MWMTPDDPALLEGLVTLLGEGYPVMLHDDESL